MYSTALKDGSYIELQASVLRQMPRPEELSKGMAEFWQKHQEELKKVLRDALSQKPFVPILRRLTTDEDSLVIKATTGQEFVTEAKKTFTGYVDHNFENWNLNKASKPTEEIKTDVYELVEDATVAEMFGSLSADLDKLCLTLSQVKGFCDDNPDWLHRLGFSTFCLIKEKNNFFVTRVSLFTGGLHFRVRNLKNKFVWDADDHPRLVTPRL